jgi:hypothetical protein
MDRVFFEGIRCFPSRQEVPLAPVTILVGENSTGKSTVLALIRLAWDVVQREELDFNEEPFLLGAYDQIASALGQEEQRVKFTIGWKTEVGSFEGKFVEHDGQPVLEKTLAEIPPYKLEYRYSSVTHQEDIFLVEGPVEKGGELDLALEIDASMGVQLYNLARPYAFAPIRTRPRRTYDPIKRAVNPEGDHVPLLLASSALRRSNEWQRLVGALESFGKHSGLFTRVDVRQLGESESDPFQIQIHLEGKVVNLIDVGYGVSQVLPIIVDCLRGDEGGIYLLQQPEVHLHPKAQAELGSFLGVLAKQQNKRFVIETHSDYLVDRVRMDIRDKKGLTPADVALLYFERKNGEATIHRLELDEQGNILNAPPGYRSFFLEEERRFLGG